MFGFHKKNIKKQLVFVQEFKISVNFLNYFLGLGGHTQKCSGLALASALRDHTLRALGDCMGCNTYCTISPALNLFFISLVFLGDYFLVLVFEPRLVVLKASPWFCA